MILFQALISCHYNSKSISTASHQLYLWKSCDSFLGKTVPRVRLLCFYKITRHQKVLGAVPDDGAIRAGRPQHLCLNNASACSESTKRSQQMLRDLPRGEGASADLQLGCVTLGLEGAINQLSWWIRGCLIWGGKWVIRLLTVWL